VCAPAEVIYGEPVDLDALFDECLQIASRPLELP
jgi:hypothetical protein